MDDAKARHVADPAVAGHAVCEVLVLPQPVVGKRLVEADPGGELAANAHEAALHELDVGLTIDPREPARVAGPGESSFRAAENEVSEEGAGAPAPPEVRLDDATCRGDDRRVAEGGSETREQPGLDLDVVVEKHDDISGCRVEREIPLDGQAARARKHPHPVTVRRSHGRARFLEDRRPRRSPRRRADRRRARCRGSRGAAPGAPVWGSRRRSASARYRPRRLRTIIASSAGGDRLARWPQTPSTSSSSARATASGA